MRVKKNNTPNGLLVNASITNEISVCAIFFEVTYRRNWFKFAKKIFLVIDLNGNEKNASSQSYNVKLQ